MNSTTTETETETLRDAIAAKLASLRDLPALLAAYEATGDHDHGHGPLRPGAPCSGGDCLVADARRLLSAVTS